MAGVRVHHLNCGTMCPFGRRFINGHGGAFEKGRIICHVLLIEGADCLTLFDTGFGSDDVRTAKQMDRAFKALTFPRLELAETAIEQIKQLGLDPVDVRNIVLTHLDIDHSGGLPDFPKARVHVWASELETMRNPPLRERRRYSISRSHWEHNPDWVEHAEAGDDWFGFESVRVLPDTGAEILLIPLPGHTLGHTAVALREEDRWLLHCGDAYFHHGDIQTPRQCPPGCAHSRRSRRRTRSSATRTRSGSANSPAGTRRGQPDLLARRGRIRPCAGSGRRVGNVGLSEVGAPRIGN